MEKFIYKTLVLIYEKISESAVIKTFMWRDYNSFQLLMTILTNILSIELQALFHNEESHWEVIILKWMVISKNQAHFKTLTVKYKKLIHLGGGMIPINNLIICMLLIQIAYRPQKLVMSSIVQLLCLNFNMLRSKSLYGLVYLKKPLLPLNCKLTCTPHQWVINNIIYRKILYLTF